MGHAASILDAPAVGAVRVRWTSVSGLGRGAEAAEAVEDRQGSDGSAG